MDVFFFFFFFFLYYLLWIHKYCSLWTPHVCLACIYVNPHSISRIMYIVGERLVVQEPVSFRSFILNNFDSHRRVAQTLENKKLVFRPEKPLIWKNWNSNIFWTVKPLKSPFQSLLVQHCNPRNPSRFIWFLFGSYMVTTEVVVMTIFVKLQNICFAQFL